MIHISGDNQTVFDRVCAHLAKQGRRASLNGSCKYLMPDGLRCAIGALLSDEDCAALDALDDSQISSIFRREIATAEADRDLISDLQSAHDDSNSNAAQLRMSLERAAFRFGLNPAAADQITEWVA